MQTILFVCTGNTCRSSMAEALFKDLLEKKEKRNYQVKSAGIIASRGRPAAEEAVRTMEEEGVDLTDHETTPLTGELVEKADLILTMTYSHKINIMNMYPGAEDKVYTLKEYVREEEKKTAGKNLDISDPFGQPLTVYKECAREIKKNLEKLIKKLT